MKWKDWANRIPHQVQVTSKVCYPISWVEKFEEEHVGVTYFDAKVIVIDSSLSDKEKVITFLHEVAHAFSKEYKLNLTEAQIVKSEKMFYYLLKEGNLFKK